MRRSLLGTLIGLLCVAPLGAQTLRGTILDGASGEPVPLAYVGLLAEGQEMVVAALAGATGEFAVTAPDEGAYFVMVSRTGYETLMDGMFELGEDGVLDVRIGLTPSPVELEEMVVEAARDRTPLDISGFYDRAAIGRGHFMIREEILATSVDRIVDAFRGVPRVFVDERRPLTGGVDVLAPPALLMRRGVSECRPTLYVDRAIVESGVHGPVRPDEYVAPSDVEAIEVYTRQNDIPAEFNPVNDCGVVVIWTRMR